MNEQTLQAKLKALLKELGITEHHQEQCRMPICMEEPTLVDAGLDMFDRPQRMTAETLSAWQAMKAAALAAGHQLQLVSAFRSIDYQCQLIKNKLEKGIQLDDILQVTAIPGYSEHHSGRALDLHAGEGEPLETSFELEPAFHWLCQNAGRFQFVLSYPRDNPSGIDYEPWHWCYQPTTRDTDN